MLTLKVISPEKIVFTGEVESVTVPGTLGEFEVLDGHAPLISSLEKGMVAYKPVQSERARLAIRGGFVEVQKNQISLCVEL